jgi:hypothetical protein
MPRRKNPDRMTAEEEIRSVLDWAKRTGHLNIAAALERAIGNCPSQRPHAPCGIGHDHRPGGRMWQLSMTNAAKEWIPVGTFDSVTAAARRIREIEDRPSCGIFLEMFVNFGTDEDAFSVLHHTGRKALYGIRRRANRWPASFPSKSFPLPRPTGFSPPPSFMRFTGIEGRKNFAP